MPQRQPAPPASFLRDPAGRSQVAAAVQLGLEQNLGEFAARAMNNLGLLSLWRGRPVQALEDFERLVEYTQTRELDAWYIAAIATRATLNVMHGRWDQADLDLEMVMGQAPAGRPRSRRSTPPPSSEPDVATPAPPT
jgi:tetratricopeptide (TPR) repeat protein